MKNRTSAQAPLWVFSFHWCFLFRIVFLSSSCCSPFLFVLLPILFVLLLSSCSHCLSSSYRCSLPLHIVCPLLYCCSLPLHIVCPLHIVALFISHCCFLPLHILPFFSHCCSLNHVTIFVSSLRHYSHYCSPIRVDIINLNLWMSKDAHNVLVLVINLLGFDWKSKQVILGLFKNAETTG